MLAAWLRGGHPRAMRAWRAAPLALFELVALVALMACQTSAPPRQTSPAPDAQQILRAPLLTSKPLTLDPALITDPASAEVASLIYPSLMALDSQMVAHTWAAESVDISSDGLSLTFHLRGAIYFSDGEPITAETFAYSLNRALDPCTNAPDVTPLLMLAGAAAFHKEQCMDAAADTLSGPVATLIGASGPITVVDPLTLKLWLERPWMGALAALTAPVTFAIPQALAQSAGSQWTERLADNGGLGGSLFMLTQEPGAGTGGQAEEARLTRNPRFWGTAAALREIDFYLYASESDEWAAYQAGKLDAGYPPPAKSLAKAVEDGVQVTPLLNLLYLGLNWGVEPLTDASLRQALALAIDKQSLADDTLGGLVAPTNHLLPQGEPGYNPSLVGPDQTQNLTGDTAKAVKLASAFASSRCAGQFSGCPELTMEVAAEDSDGLAVAAAIARMWQAVAPGYPLQVRQEPRAELEARIASGAAQLYLDEWQAAYPDPSAWLDAAFGPGAPGVGVGAATPDVQTLLTQGQAEQDPAQRAKDYQAAEQLLVSDVAWIPLAQERVFWQARPAISGFTLDAQNALAVYDTAPAVVIMLTEGRG